MSGVSKRVNGPQSQSDVRITVLFFSSLFVLFFGTDCCASNPTVVRSGPHLSEVPTQSRRT